MKLVRRNSLVIILLAGLLLCQQDLVDPKNTGLPVTYSDTGAYIMWAGTTSAHLHIMGRP